MGASYATSGLGDMALYEGRLADAARIFEHGAAEDLKAKEADRAANKLVALAHSQVLRNARGSHRAAERALTHSQSVKIRFLAARVFVEAGAFIRLRRSRQRWPPTFRRSRATQDARRARRDEERQRAGGNHADERGQCEVGYLDWPLRARAGLPERGAFTQADSEFNRCLKRRGEALALFSTRSPPTACSHRSTTIRARRAKV